jgi:hypothetical protein
MVFRNDWSGPVQGLSGERRGKRFERPASHLKISGSALKKPLSVEGQKWLIARFMCQKQAKNFERDRIIAIFHIHVDSKAEDLPDKQPRQLPKII